VAPPPTSSSTCSATTPNPGSVSPFVFGAFDRVDERIPTGRPRTRFAQQRPLEQRRVLVRERSKELGGAAMLSMVGPQVGLERDGPLAQLGGDHAPRYEARLCGAVG